MYLFSNESTSFNLMFCRIWQFMVGTLAHLITTYFAEPSEYQRLEMDDKEDEDLEEVDKHGLSKFLNLCCSNGLAVLLAGICLFYIPIEATFARFFTTFLTGIIIIFGNSILPSILMSNTAIVYVGDISYILYLVHWPTLLFNRYMEITNESGGVLVSILLAVIIHHFVENPIVASKWSAKKLFGNIVKLILIVVALLELAKWKVEVVSLKFFLPFF
uniref:Acyltransferase 3 domain-containing protein n=1 Tax=Panagrolaimus sp. PS1159 TaxID=55785 RepID=A0AC35FLM3_9BILA